MRIHALVATLLLVACEPLVGAGQRPEGTRQLVLSLPSELVSGLGSEVTALQLSAVVVKPDSVRLYNSPATDPSTQRQLVTYVRMDASALLLVQTLGAGGVNAPGALVARLRFANGYGGQTSRVPAGDADLALGLARFAGDVSSPANAFLDIDDSNNPLAFIDSNDDGESDLSDTDDDGDGTADREDEDVDGDEIADLLQDWSALEDLDSDGVPDLFQ
jgi:hypothetical protein